MSSANAAHSATACPCLRMLCTGTCHGAVQFVQTAHPPKRQIRGRTPRVHKGFLATWRTNAIHERVIEHVSALLDSAEDRARVRVFTCGHSLGGAVASLASYDFVTRCGISPEQITCNTFGWCAVLRNASCSVQRISSNSQDLNCWRARPSLLACLQSTRWQSRVCSGLQRNGAQSLVRRHLLARS